jgi:hypothetical protein
MMNYAYYTSVGQYVVAGTSDSDEEIIASDIPTGCSVYYGLVNPNTQYHNISTGKPADKGPAPQEDGYVFDYVTKSWNPDIPYLDFKAKAIRNQKLADSDWTDTASAPARLGQELYDQWQTYRQALRDVTAQPGYPFNIIWPTPPQ